MQLNFPKNQLYASVAESFQRAGYTTLVYDPRGVGTSDGQPRGDISPVKQTEDYHDAVTFMKSQRTVDGKKIALWGYSLSAAEALAAAALDRRVKLVMAICPAVPFDMEHAAKRSRFLSQAMRDRESRARGNPPLCLPFIGDSDDGPLFNYRRFRGMADAEYDAVQDGLAAIPHFRNEITIQTFYNMIAWSFHHQLPLVSPTPVLQINAGEEELPYLKKEYDIIFDKLQSPKQLHVEPDSGHMDILIGDEKFAALMKVQIAFVEKYFGD